MWRLSIQNHSKPFITRKRKKARYLTWNFIRLKFVKKTRMPNPGKSLEYVKCYSSSSPRPVKSPSSSIRYNCEKICSWSRRPKTMLEIRKEATFLYVINNPIIYKFFKDFTNHKNNSNRAVVFVESILSKKEIMAMWLISEKKQKFCGHNLLQQSWFHTSSLLEAAIGMCSGTFCGCFHFSDIFWSHMISSYLDL